MKLNFNIRELYLNMLSRELEVTKVTNKEDDTGPLCVITFKLYDANDWKYRDVSPTTNIYLRGDYEAE